MIRFSKNDKKQNSNEERRDDEAKHKPQRDTAGREYNESDDLEIDECHLTNVTVKTNGKLDGIKNKLTTAPLYVIAKMIDFHGNYLETLQKVEDRADEKKRSKAERKMGMM